MPKRKIKLKQASHDPKETAANKDAFVKALEAGIAPGQAAKKVGVGRSTAYTWKKNDPAFDAKWEEAVETSLDDLETTMYSLAKGGDTHAIEHQLKWRRRGTYQNTNEDRVATSQHNYILNVTLKEQCERLERLGLPVPVIETDYEVLDEDAAKDS